MKIYALFFSLLTLPIVGMADCNGRLESVGSIEVCGDIRIGAENIKKIPALNGNGKSIPEPIDRGIVVRSLSIEPLNAEQFNGNINSR